MKIFFSVSLAAIAFAFLGALPAEGKLLVGWLEKVRINPGNLIIYAKLDSGAKNSSLNASHVTAFERDGEQWVRFDVTSRYGKTVTIKRRVKRVVKIKRHGAKPQARYAVNLGICLGDSYKEVEVNLAERSDFLYQMLIGRSFLASSFIVDPSAKYTTKPNCSFVPGQ